MTALPEERSPMRTVLTCLLLLAVPAWAQAPAPKSVAPDKAAVEKAMVPQKKCADCGVVTSVKVVKKELPPTDAADAKPSGLVASVPFGGGRPQVGSSSKREGKDAPIVSETWEVTVRLDDGRYRLAFLNQRPDPELREGDKVRFDANGRVALRTD
jgi:hypothetical protein